MADDNKTAIQALLAMKSKAAGGVAWTAEEKASVNSWLRETGQLSVLAASCVLASERSQEYPTALGLVRQAVQSGQLSPYVELSVYEALVYVAASELVSFADALFPFIQGSMSSRAIDLTNTIFVLGKMARAGDRRAVALLEPLANDSDPNVRNNVSAVLSGLSGP